MYFILTMVLIGVTCALPLQPLRAELSDCSLSQMSSEQSQWKRYTVKNEEFSVLLPELPAMTTSKEYLYWSAGDSRRIRVLGAYSNEVVYSIYTFENSMKQSLNDFVARYSVFRQQNIEIKSRRDLTLNGFQGKEVVITTPNSEEVMQFWGANNNLYVLKTTCPKDVTTSSREFFSSLSLGSKQEGEQVNDGPGAQFDQAGTSNSSQAGSEGSLTFVGRDVTRKAILGTKPEPSYTEDARNNGTAGAVVLKAIFSSKGRVTNIRVVVELPNGLTERAIAAARQIRFIPAVKDGKYVSMWMQLEYNFNLY